MLREALPGNEAVTEALESGGYTTDDVIALQRDGGDLTLIGDTRDS